MLHGSTQHLVISAPGKVILHGEHAVVHGKRALACSLNLRTFLHVTPSLDGIVRIHLPDIDIYHEWHADSIKMNLCNNNQSGDSFDKPCAPSEERIRHICRFCGLDEETQNTKDLATAAFIYLYTAILSQDQMQGLDFMVSSNLPTSAGLGSSAAFGVSLVASLLALSGHISSPQSESFNAWSGKEQEIINEWAFVAEKIIHGNPSGVDNSVSTFGGIVKYQNKQLEKVNMKHELEVLITNTKVPRSTKKLVAGVADKMKKFPTVIESVLDTIEAISVHAQEELSSSHEPDMEVLKILVSDNHHLLTVLGVSHESLDQIFRITGDRGLSSKLTGAGGGGCTFTLLPPGTCGTLVAEVKVELEILGFQCWQTVVGGPGVGLHTGQEAQFNIPHALQERARLCNIL